MAVPACPRPQALLPTPRPCPGCSASKARGTRVGGAAATAGGLEEPVLRRRAGRARAENREAERGVMRGGPAKREKQASANTAGGDFPGGSEVTNLLPLQKSQVQPLVGD